MAKQRYIKDSFWTDPYIQDLSSTEKLVFLYLLTNDSCNIAGIYEITERQICFDTGIDQTKLKKIISRLNKDGKVVYEKNWIIIINFIKNQNLNPSVKKGIERVLLTLPDWLQDRLGTDCIQAGTYSTLLNFTLLNLTLTGKKQKILKKSKDPTDQEYGNNEINLLLEKIKLYNNGICDGTQKEQRQYGKNLIGKLKKIDKIKNGEYERIDYLESLLKIISQNQYHSGKISGPKKIFYSLAELIQVANQSVKRETTKQIPTFTSL